MTSVHAYCVNLLPKERVVRRLSLRSASRWAGINAAILLLIGVPSVIGSIHFRTAPIEHGSQISRLSDEVNALNAIIPDLSQELRLLELRRFEQKLAAQRVEWTSVIERIVPTLPKSAQLMGFQAELVSGETPSASIMLIIQTIDETSVRDAIVRIEGAGHFDRVEMIESQRVPTKDGERVRSTIQFSVTGPSQGDAG